MRNKIASAALFADRKVCFTDEWLCYISSATDATLDTVAKQMAAGDFPLWKKSPAATFSFLSLPRFSWVRCTFPPLL